MNKNTPWYIEQRADALALVYLTRRDDLVVRQTTHHDMGVDYMIEIVKDAHPTGRIFGLQLKAYLTEGQGNILQKKIGVMYEQWMEELPFPLCLFLFIMESNEGHYMWLSEPIVKGDHQPKLQINKQGVLERLDNDALERIVSSVNTWYDALKVSLTS